MGLNAGLYVIPAEKFNKARAKGTWDRYAWHKCGPWFDVDKAWWEFTEAFKERGGPLAYAIEGDMRPNPDELDFTFVSPDVVAQIAVILEGKDFADEIVEESARQSGLGWDEKQVRGYYAANFAELRKAYRTAAARGAAIGVLIC